MSKSESRKVENKTTKAIPCNCTSAFQDRRYKKGYRLHNAGIKEGEYACTVCGNKTSSGSKKFY